MEDSFDEGAQTLEIDLDRHATQLYLQANPGSEKPRIFIEEMTLSGATDYSQKLNTHWSTNEPQSLVQGLK